MSALTQLFIEAGIPKESAEKISLKLESMEFSRESFATKNDLNGLEVRLNKEIGEREIALIREMSQMEVRLNKEINQVKDELKEDITKVRGEINQVKEELTGNINQVRNDLTHLIIQTKEEMHQDNRSQLFWIIGTIVSLGGVLIGVIKF